MTGRGSKRSFTSARACATNTPSAGRLASVSDITTDPYFRTPGTDACCTQYERVGGGRRIGERWNHIRPGRGAQCGSHCRATGATASTVRSDSAELRRTCFACCPARSNCVSVRRFPDPGSLDRDERGGFETGGWVVVGDGAVVERQGAARRDAGADQDAADERGGG